MICLKKCQLTREGRMISAADLAAGNVDAQPDAQSYALRSIMNAKVQLSEQIQPNTAQSQSRKAVNPTIDLTFRPRAGPPDAPISDLESESDYSQGRSNLAAWPAAVTCPGQTTNPATRSPEPGPDPVKQGR